jgi:hypothetical protein
MPDGMVQAEKSLASRAVTRMRRLKQLNVALDRALRVVFVLRPCQSGSERRPAAYEDEHAVQVVRQDLLEDSCRG